MDEHRLGLQPVLKRVWWPIGLPCVAPVQPRYEWLWVYGFVHPPTGATFWYLAPSVSIAWFSLMLAEFARAVGVGSHKQVVLVLDGAGFHTSPKVKIPTGIHLAQLPARSPELQPAERLWSFVDEPIVNKTMEHIAHLEDVIAARCVVLRETLAAKIQEVTAFYWWPQCESSTV